MESFDTPSYAPTFPAVQTANGPETVSSTAGETSSPNSSATTPSSSSAAAAAASSPATSPTPYLDIMSCRSEGRQKRSSSSLLPHHLLFVEPVAIPSLAHTGISSALLSSSHSSSAAAANPGESTSASGAGRSGPGVVPGGRITYPNGEKRSNLQELVRVELRGALYDSTDEFRLEDIRASSSSSSSASAHPQHTDFTAAAQGRRRGGGSATTSRRRRRKKSTTKGPRTGRSTLARRGKRTLQRLELRETSPFWKKPGKKKEVRERDQQVQGLLRSLRGFGHVPDVRK